MDALPPPLACNSNDSSAFRRLRFGERRRFVYYARFDFLAFAVQAVQLLR